MASTFLAKGHGNQNANRKKAMAYVLEHITAVIAVDERTVDFPPWGRCHFSAYTDENGAMISSSGRDDNAFGSADWHARDKIMMFRDFGDGRCMIYVCPIKPLFAERTIGMHGVKWPDVQKHADFMSVFCIA